MAAWFRSPDRRARLSADWSSERSHCRRFSSTFQRATTNAAAAFASGAFVPQAHIVPARRRRAPRLHRNFHSPHGDTHANEKSF